MERAKPHLGFAFVLAVVSIAATWAGLTGSWVADDWHMVDNYLYSDWAELGAVFKRNAAYYLFTEDQAGPYRPTTMLTLLGTHLLAAKPWLHHGVSWLLHALTALLLFAVLRQQLPRDDGARVDVCAATLAAFFFLHPVHVESYVWINGRSDLLGGFWLVALAFLLNKASAEQSDAARRALVIGFVAFLGAGSKLPFAIGAAAVWLAWAIRERSPMRALHGGAIGFGLGAHVVLRMMFAPFTGRVGMAENVLFDGGVWLALPRLFAQGLASLVTLRAEAMQSLSWMLFGPWSVYDWAGLAIAALVLTALARRRDWSSLVYFVGAFATMAPVAAVSRSFWMGFDRYLYMPSILIILALAPYVLHLFVFRHRSAGLALVMAGGVVLGSAAIQTYRASAAYADQEAYDRALLADHPDDPTTHYYLARIEHRAGNDDALRDRLAAMPPPPWPVPIIAPTYDLAVSVNDTKTALRAVDALVASGEPRAACDHLQRLEAIDRSAQNPTIVAALAAGREQLSCGR